jgi:hypothetical protein
MQSAFRTLARAALIAAPVLLFANAQAEEIVENVRIGGSYLTSRINANGDTQASSWCTLQIKGGQQGSSMQQCINEDVPMPPTPDCPGGVFVVDALNGTGRGVRTFANGNDQLFIELTERHLCVGLNAAGPFFKESYDRGVIIGGAGKFVGATGTYEATYTGTILYGDPSAVPPQFFGSIAGTATWQINVPD